MSASLTRSGSECACFRRIDDRSLQRTDRKIRPLRQHHQVAFAGIAIEPLPNGQMPAIGAEQGRFAGAGRTGDERALIARGC